MIKLYLLKTGDVAATPEGYFAENCPERLARSEKYRFREDRLRCLGAGILLSEVLKVPEKRLRVSAAGKPYLPGSEVRFNMSHSGEYTVLAVSGRETGVDIEKQDERHLDLARRVFLPEEIRWMEEEPVKRFFILWSMKESVMKAAGTGLSLPPESFSVLPMLTGGSCSVCGKEYRGCTLDLIPGYGLSVCCENADENADENAVDVFDVSRRDGGFEICSHVRDGKF